MPRMKLGLIHTSATLVPVFYELCEELLPNVDVFNIADDSLIKEVIACGTLTANVSRRLFSHVQSAETAGADLILVTCSSIGAAVEACQAFVSVPVVRVDQAMADHAVLTAHRIGVVATLPTTLAPTADLIERRANISGKSVEVIERLCVGAFDALMSGDAVTHDQLVRDQLEELAGMVDTVVLAQASMARTLSHFSGQSAITPILSSPRLAIESLVQRIN